MSQGFQSLAVFLYPNDLYYRIYLDILFSSNYVCVLSFSVHMIHICLPVSLFLYSIASSYPNWQLQRPHFCHMKLTLLSCQFTPYLTTIQATADRHCLTKFLLYVFLYIILNGSSNSTIHLITSFYFVVEVNFPYLRYCPFQDFKCIQLFTTFIIQNEFLSY